MNEPLVWHIVSYPRSGNHLVRSIIEAYTHRSTEGCWGSNRDQPIHLRKPNSNQLIQVSDDIPIGSKAHSVREIHERERELPNQKFGMILITRDPVSAITSQSVRVLRNRRKFPIASDRSVRITIENQVERYLSLIFRFLSFSDERRVHIKFEDLMDPDLREGATEEFLGRIGAELDGVSLKQVMDLAKASQKSLSHNRPTLETRVRRAVKERITYDEVGKYLGLDLGQ